VLLSRGISILLRKAIQSLFCISLFLFTCATPGLSQKIQPDGSVRTHSCSAAAQYGIRTGK
jgi:hypothetical protein